ncbi:GNAT family N-acetyltransferase [Anaerocolumna sp. AGMB13025]|uniref:GNAT family N-acetyltransferase n=1 Tax=Anaerocolumna sp. AGMB13025 TaxID=3039116 RepID=UPI00241FBD1B|nr:GNAT family N-acetyltransferase [Anaerocolumna sp. AGMB13025]WFR58796.1 GNAT family N-acetyltransferase [Anaerocolumna sp. AGMB13025]
MNQTEEFTLRFAEEKDITLIYDLIKELAVYEKLEDRVIASREDLRESIFDRKVAEVILAELNGVTVGYAMYFYNFSSFIGKPGLYLEDIFIRPSYRGRGFGKAVLAYLAELAVKRNCWGMEWTCLDWNEPSIKFYESIGAVQNGGWRIYRLKGEALLNLSQN